MSVPACVPLCVHQARVLSCLFHAHGYPRVYTRVHPGVYTNYTPRLPTPQGLMTNTTGGSCRFGMLPLWAHHPFHRLQADRYAPCML
jgi:hypothetical protein